MARIQSTLALNDQMSGVLRRINKAMSLTLDSFEAVQRASGRSFNTQNISAARQEMGRANAVLDEMERHYQDCNGQQNQLNKNLSRGSSAANGLLGKIKGIAAAYLGMNGLKALGNLSDTMSSNRARLDLIVDDGGSVEDLEKKIYASAQRSRASYLDTMSTVSKLGLMAGDSFKNNDEIIKFQELVNKNFVVGGAAASEQSAAMYQLMQAMGSGRLQGDEYRSIIENAPLLAKSIEDYMRNTQQATGTMKDWASEGKLTADVIKAAVFTSADEVEERFNAMPKTWSQIWTDMKNRAVVALDPLLTKINQLANNERIQKTMSSIAKNIAGMAVLLAQVFDWACAIYNFFATNWSWIGPIIAGIAAALVLYNAVMGISSLVLGIMCAAETAKTAGTVADAIATGSATAAQTAFNAALWACPITWIIALVIALIVIFVIFTQQIMGAIFWLGALFKNIGLCIANTAIAVWNAIKNIGLWFGNLGLAIWQVIKNIGLWFGNLGLAIWQGIKNVGAWFGNLGMGVWEVIKACASNIGVALNNAWVTVQQGFWGMVNVIMQGLKSLAETANKVLGWMGVNIDTSGLDFAAKKIDELNSKKEEYESISDAWAEGSKTFETGSVGDAMSTFEYGSVGDAMGTFDIDWGNVGDGLSTFDVWQDGWGSDAYNAGAEVGAGIQDWLGDTFSFGGIADKLGFDSGTGGGGITDPLGYGDTLGDIADSTGSTADNTSKSNEELSYLRDIAEKEAINRFTTAEIKVDMTGMTNRIDSNMDLDGVISYLTTGVADALATAGEGVY